MKFTITHIHRNSATDRTHPAARAGAAILSALLLATVTAPSVAALSAPEAYTAIEEHSSQAIEITVPATLISDRGVLSPADPESMAAELTNTFTFRTPHETPDQGENPTENNTVTEDQTPPDGEKPTIDIFDPTLPLTQELIAQRIESRMDKQVKGGSTVRYPYPAGSMAVDLYKDGKQILKGQVVDIGGTVYVPVQRFADLFGRFKTVYTEATEQVVITGTNLSITVKVGDPYITVNERIFYTGKKVISLGGWIFVPLTSMCKALNATVTIRQGYYDAFVTSGDPTKVKWASEYYNSTDLYWLSRIISAEAKGEPFTGQLAVGNVVLNRVASPNYPNTIYGVIFDRKHGVQFTPAANGTIYDAPTVSAIRAAKACLEGYTLSERILYFFNPRVATSQWIANNCTYVFRIGEHVFYR